MEWSASAEPADWILPRLAPFGSGSAASVVPRGFAAYARLLHPVSRPSTRGRTPVRWREVAEWSGVGLRSDSQWPDVALPEHRPRRSPPWSGEPPEEGNLAEPDLRALVDALQVQTTGRSRWWFAIWDGHGWEDWEPPLPPPDRQRQARAPVGVDKPVPDAVLTGSRVRHPQRSYLLYSGAPDDALLFVNLENQSPNLWWPDDRSWCVATEIDLPYTYLGGSAELIHRLVTDSALEAQEVSPDQSFRLRAPDWVRQRASDAVDELIREHEVTLDLWAGSVRATLTRADWGEGHQLAVEVETVTANGDGMSAQPLTASSGETTRDQLVRNLVDGILELVY